MWSVSYWAKYLQDTPRVLWGEVDKLSSESSQQPRKTSPCFDSDKNLKWICNTYKYSPANSQVTGQLSPIRLSWRPSWRRRIFEDYLRSHQWVPVSFQLAHATTWWFIDLLGSVYCYEPQKFGQNVESYRKSQKSLFLVISYLYLKSCLHLSRSVTKTGLMKWSWLSAPCFYKEASHYCFEHANVIYIYVLYVLWRRENQLKREVTKISRETSTSVDIMSKYYVGIECYMKQPPRDMTAGDTELFWSKAPYCNFVYDKN